MDESVDDFGQLEDSPSVVDQTARIRGLEAELADYKSRLGRAAQEFGEDKARIIREYSDWQTNWKAYYDEELAKRDKVISNLEDDLMQLDQEGARAVVEQRNARQKMDEDARAQREQAMMQAQRELAQAKEEALAVFPTVKLEDFATVTTGRAVWALAARLDRERTTPVVSTQPTREERREQEVRDVEETSRVPAPVSRAPQTTPVAGRTNPVQAQIDELEIKRADFIRRGRLSEAMGTLRQIAALRAQLT